MLTRRTLMAATAAAPLVATEAATEAHAATPKNVVVMAKQIDDVISFDPAEAYEFTNNEVNGNVYRRLVAPDHANNSRVVGDLAQSWTISKDGLTFTFKLKTNAKFPSGKTLTAEDVQFSLARVVKLNKTPAFIITQFGYTKDNVDSLIVAKDPTTLVMTLPEAAAPSFVLFCLSAAVGSVVEKATVMAHDVGGDLGNAWLKSHSAGAGAYQLTDWVASDHITIDANPHSGIATGVKRIAIRHVADPSAQLLLLQKGDADIARDLTPDLLTKIKAEKAFTVTASGQGSSMYIAMNQAVPELQKVQVHQAIKWAIDYEAIAKNITPNQWVVAQGFLPPGLPGAMTAKPFHKDVAKAKALLAEAGYPNGFTVTMDFISVAPYGDIAQAIQADLAAIGIKVNLLPGEQKQVITKTRARTHQLAILVWGTDYFDPNSNAQAWCENPDDSDQSKLKILAWRSHYVDKELNDMAVAASKELDGAKRIKMYEDMQVKFAARAPFAMVLQKIASAALGKGVSGFVIGPLPDFTKFSDIKKA
jgi:peptide/nickel transport system substrate-binding protein